MQPAFLVAIIDANDNTSEASFGSVGPKGESFLDVLGVYIKKSPEMLKRYMF